MIDEMTSSLTEIFEKYKKVLSIWYSRFASQLSVIVEEVLKEVKPISIYLIGSFGRDEGSIFILNEEIRPFRDYDVLLIVNNHVNYNVIRKIRINIHKRLGLLDPYSDSFKFKGFTVWITQATLEEINTMPLLKFYELKMASKLLYGRDIRPDIRLKIEEVSLYNGVLILFSKIEGLLGLLELNMGNECCDLIYECMKTYVEIATCLSLLDKNLYAPSFLLRCQNVLQRFKETFPDLLCMSEDLPRLIEKCTYNRLLISPAYIKNFDASHFLIETLRNLGLAIWYFLNKAYGIQVSPLTLENINEYEDRFSTVILEDLFQYFLRRKLGFSTKIMSRIASQLYLRYALLKFVMRGRKYGKPIRLSLVFSRNANIMLRLWLIGFLLLKSISPHFKFDEKILAEVKNRLSNIINQEFLDQSISEVDVASKFLSLRKILLDLLDLADKIYHRKG